MVLPIIIRSCLRLQLCADPRSLVVNSCNVTRPAKGLFASCSSVRLTMVPNITFSRAKRQLKENGNCCSGLLPRVATAGLKVYFPFRLLRRMPTRPFSVYVSRVVAG